MNLFYEEFNCVFLFMSFDVGRLWKNSNYIHSRDRYQSVVEASKDVIASFMNFLFFKCTYSNQMINSLLLLTKCFYLNWLTTTTTLRAGSSNGIHYTLSFSHSWCKRTQTTTFWLRNDTSFSTCQAFKNKYNACKRDFACTAVCAMQKKKQWHEIILRNNTLIMFFFFPSQFFTLNNFYCMKTKKKYKIINEMQEFAYSY